MDQNFTNTEPNFLKYLLLLRISVRTTVPYAPASLAYRVISAPPYIDDSVRRPQVQIKYCYCLYERRGSTRLTRGRMDGWMDGSKHVRAQLFSKTRRKKCACGTYEFDAYPEEIKPQAGHRTNDNSFGQKIWICSRGESCT